MSRLNKEDKIYIAGHTGLVGSAIHSTLIKQGYNNIVTRTINELNLLDTNMVNSFYRDEKPDVVFVAAARVGGIFANNSYRAEFIYENLQIQNNVIWGAHQANVHRLVFLGSSCIYPKNAIQPMDELCLLSSELEYTNRPYAIAKIAGLELVNCLRSQYNRDYFSAMPTNLYGPNDNFHKENAHVLPALIRRFIEAKNDNLKEITIWGTGTPFREFMYSLDCAEALVYLAETVTKEKLDNSSVGQAGWSHINIGTGEEISIANLAQLISKNVGFEGVINFDTSKPDGTARKLLNVSLLNKLGYHYKTLLTDGINNVIKWYMTNLIRK